MLLVAADNDKSDAFGNLQIDWCPSSRDIPKTTNILAYTIGLYINNA